MFATQIAQSVNVSTTRRDVEIDKKEMSKPVEEMTEDMKKQHLFQHMF